MDDAHEEWCVLDCGHIFHHFCALQWLEMGKKECPKCKVPVGFGCCRGL
jgi:hypothetical protein